MASIIRMANGRKAVQFTALDDKRPTIRLGKCSMRNAETVKRHVEGLVAAQIQNSTPDDETSKWVRDIGRALAEKLAAVGLIAPRAGSTTTLKGFVGGYIDGRGDVKTGTRTAARVDAASLVGYFGPQRLLRTITVGDVDQFAVWLRQQGLAPATIGRRLKRYRQFFRAAMRRRLILENPFADVKAPAQTNESRKAFITTEQTAKLLDACPDADWRLIVALARYGGLRCPSEVLALRWGDVDWEKSRIRVRSPKTEHLPGGASRLIPLFPELRPHLDAAFFAPGPDTVHIVNRYRDATANLRTQLLRIIGRAGLTPWPKPFHNLRASRETELAATFPLHVVCDWIGNSERIADRHYLQVTDEHFETAAGGAAKSDANALRNAMQTVAGRICQPMTKSTQASTEQDSRPIPSSTVTSCPQRGMTPTGLEPVSRP